jgi:hypothetical protein
MVELNSAYAKVRTADLRHLYDRERRQHKAVSSGAGTPSGKGAPPDDAAGGRALDFGRYEGWTVAQIARRDPDYLRWLSRHSAGARFRTEIEAALRSAPRGKA